MSVYYEIKITGGTSPGKYSLYYDVVNPGTVLNEYPSNNILTGLTLSQMTTGVLAETPVTASKIILFNDGRKCKNQIVFELDPQPEQYPCLCILIFDLSSSQQYNYDFCYNGVKFNSKPLYTNQSFNINWNNSGYWELSGVTINGHKFRSNDTDNVPDSDWYTVGVNPSNYVILSQTGSCSNFVSNVSFLFAKGYDSDCASTNGYIYATALGGNPQWEYSINGGPTNSIGFFDNLGKGTYIVTAKDSVGNILQETVIIDSPPVNDFPVEPSSITTKINDKIGNVQYYEAEIIYDTSFIPNGETITFNYVIEYNLIYEEPGSVTFVTNNNQVFKNSIQQPVTQINPGTLTPVSQSQCDSNYSIYNGQASYETPQITLNNTDNFMVKFVYGINTSENGAFVNPCFTKADVSINSYFTKLEYTCDCCVLNDNQVSITQPTQIFQ